jgi:hypothetical protein
MRKNTLRILCLAMVLCCILSLAACSLAFGKYELDSASMGGMTLTAEMFKEYMGECYVEMTPFGTAKFAYGDEVLDMKYANGKIWPVEEGEEEAVNFKVEGNKISMEMDGMELIFKK